MVDFCIFLFCFWVVEKTLDNGVEINRLFLLLLVFLKITSSSFLFPGSEMVIELGGFRT